MIEKYQRVQSQQVHRIPAHRSNIVVHYTVIFFYNTITASILRLSLYKYSFKSGHDKHCHTPCHLVNRLLL